MKWLLLAAAGLGMSIWSGPWVLAHTGELAETLFAAAAWLLAGGLVLVLWGRAAEERRRLRYQAAASDSSVLPWPPTYNSPLRAAADAPRPQGEAADSAVVVQVRSYAPSGAVSYLTGELLARPARPPTPGA